MEEVTLLDLDRLLSLGAVFKPHAPGFEKPVEVPASMMMPI
jgi:hypothetical protein